MTLNDKKQLLYFITRTGMYINPVDDRNIVSFINGYELGRNGRCTFTLKLKQHIENKHSIRHSSDGWPGQIRRLAEKRSLSQVIIFKMLTLEMITLEEDARLHKVLKDVLKTRILSLSRKLENTDTLSEWIALCPFESEWFRLLWTDAEWAFIRSVNEKLVYT